MAATIDRMQAVRPRWRAILGGIKDLPWIAWGTVVYLFNGKTPSRSWQGIIRLFCATSGWSQEIFHKLISIRYPCYRNIEARGVLGNLDPTEVASIVQTIDREGFFVAPVRLHEAQCDQLLEFALNAQYNWVDGWKENPERFDRENPTAIKYQITQERLISNPVVQDLMADNSFLSVAQTYLNCAPTLDLIGLWWTTDYSRVPDRDSATMFHFDMTRIRWLNVFVYLTDVTTASGPHTFVRGSHKPGAIPWRFLSRGYQRIADDEVIEHFGEENIIEFLGPRGTILFEDTRGLHKGKHVLDGDRLIFQISYVDSMFGGEGEASRLPSNRTASLNEMMAKTPRLFYQFLPPRRSAPDC